MTRFATKDIDQTTDTAVTLGNFDGLHRGHQELILHAKTSAEELTRNGQPTQSAVFSFFPHPAAVLRDPSFQSILTSAEKTRLVGEMGVDLLIEYPFDQAFARLDAEHFVRDVLVARMRCKTLIVGEGYRFGNGGHGNRELLMELGERCGFAVKIISHLMAGDQKISSTTVRTAILQKRFAEAAALMGRPYFVAGEVVHGNRLGHVIGVPTANISPDACKLLPPPGVYRTTVEACGRSFRGMTNVGVRPTVGANAEKTVETHLLGYDGDLYGEYLTVAFHDWIRPEIKFEGLDELRAQILSDIARVKN